MLICVDCHLKLHHMLSSSDDLLVKRTGDPLMQYKTLINNNINNISTDGLLFDTHKVVGNPLLKAHRAFSPRLRGG